MIKNHMSPAAYKALKTEKQIQNEIIEELELRGYYIQRMNSGIIPKTDKYGEERNIWLSKKGTPDIMAFKPLWQKEPLKSISKGEVKLFFIEVKKSGKDATDLQKERMEELEQYGAICLVIHSIVELQMELQKYEN